MPREQYTPQEQAYYRTYLQSKQWRDRKNARVAAAGYRCEFVSRYRDATGDVYARCTRKTYLCVHHNTYERLGAELSSDLDVYCWFHHIMEHLLWKKCTVCGEPCLGSDDIAESWLNATLLQMGIDIDSVTSDKTMESIGADSLDEVEIQMYLEDEFCLEIANEQWLQVKTVSEAIEFVKMRVRHD